VKLKLIPVTMAMGRSLLPTEPDSTAGRMGKTHGVATVAMPARNTSNMGGAADILCYSYASILSIFGHHGCIVTRCFDNEDIPFCFRIILA